MCENIYQTLYYLFSKPAKGINLWTAFWCRLKGHQCGPIWYSHGLEPDMRCKNCNDEIM
jgi:hypothetical protein